MACDLAGEPASTTVSSSGGVARGGTAERGGPGGGTRGGA